jgi:hypothetical protein
MAEHLVSTAHRLGGPIACMAAVGLRREYGMPHETWWPEAPMNDTPVG